LIGKDEILTEKEIFNLIFLPGFSTADQLSEVSGRGVGMDVVKRKIADIRGQIKISSVLNVGTYHHHKAAHYRIYYRWA
jgi:two-component system chemotaxis sensor kinase CheA